MKFSISNIEKEFLRINRESTNKIKLDLEQESKTIVQELKDATPVDTGNARNHWKGEVVSNDKVVIENTVPYIEKLNQGSSKQAPAFFVESVALRHGRPVGTILDTYKS